MSGVTIISAVAVLAGAALLWRGVTATGQLLRSGYVTRAPLWKRIRAALFGLMAAYAAVAALLFTGHADWIAPAIGLVTVGAAVFVYLIVRTSGETLDDVRRATVSQEYLENLLNSLGDAFMVVDQESKIRAGNHALHVLLGYERGSLLGTSVASIFTLEPSDLKKFIAAEEHARVETELRTRSGMLIPASVLRSRLRISDGGFDGIVCIAQDITERKRLEDEQAAARSLIDLSLQEQTGYLNLLGHELNGIVATLENQDGAATSELQRSEAVARTAAALRRVHDDVVELATGESRSLRVTPRPFSLDACLNDVLALMRPLARERDVSLARSVNKSVNDTVTSGERQLHRVLVTLLADAIERLHGGSIMLTVSRMSTSGEHPELLFELRRDGNEPNAGNLVDERGHVVGRQLVHTLGGRLWAQSRSGHRSTFFTISDAAVAPPLTSTTKRLQQYRGFTAWLVGEEDVAADELSESCRAWGIEVNRVYSGEAALASLTTSPPPDLVLVDSRTRDIRGMAFAKRIHENPELSLTVILLSESVQTEIRDGTGQFSAFLHKPVRREDLEMVLRELLGKKAAHASPKAKTPTTKEEIAGIERATPRDDSNVVSIVRRSTGRRGLKPAPVPQGRPSGKILVVDDSPSNREILSRYLRKQGHESKLASGGAEAIEMLKRDAFDVVLLDLMMPEVDGFGVLEWMGKSEKLAETSVIMISAVDDIASVARCIEAGAEDYLPKPFNPTILRARIEACLDKQGRKHREREYLKQLETESRQSDRLLRVLLPDPIVEELQRTRVIRPRRYDNVAIMFVDIVGFTSYCDQHSPEEVLARLQRVVREFERLSRHHGVQKIKTIGDAFMAASNLLYPAENPVLTCVNLGRDMIAAVREQMPDWSVRIGVHLGPVVGGVVGDRHYQFDIWGDSVNTAQRIESHGVVGSVCVSRDAWDQIVNYYEGESLGEIVAKGKGSLEVHRVVRPRPTPLEPGRGRKAQVA